MSLYLSCFSLSLSLSLFHVVSLVSLSLFHVVSLSFNVVFIVSLSLYLFCLSHVLSLSLFLCSRRDLASFVSVSQTSSNVGKTVSELSENKDRDTLARTKKN